MIHKFKSSKSLIAGLYRDLGSNTELNESDLLEWFAEALSLIGSYPQLNEIPTILTLSNHRVSLPCDFVYLKDITHQGIPLSWSVKSAVNNYNCPECNTIPKCCTENNFYIQDGILNSSIESGDICIIYLGVPIDDEGYPLVPDNIYFDKALKSYVTYMLDRQLFRRGMMPEAVFVRSEKDWLFYVNSARGSANMPDAAKMERLKNVWVRLIPNQNGYKSNFQNLENGERRKLH